MDIDKSVKNKEKINIKKIINQKKVDIITKKNNIRRLKTFGINNKVNRQLNDNDLDIDNSVEEEQKEYIFDEYGVKQYRNENEFYKIKDDIVNEDPIIDYTENNKPIRYSEIINNPNLCNKYHIHTHDIMDMILLGTQSNKQLEVNINYLINYPNELNFIINELAQMSMNTSSNEFVVNRSEQFILSLMYLKKKRYDFKKFTFKNDNDDNIDFIDFIAKYKIDYEDKLINIKFDSIEFGTSKSALSFLDDFIEQELIDNRQRFDDEYKKYIKSINKENIFSLLSFRQFMKMKYGYNGEYVPYYNNMEILETVLNNNNISKTEFVKMYYSYQEKKIIRSTLIKNEIIKYYLEQENMQSQIFNYKKRNN